MIKTTEENMKEIGFHLEGNRWVHEKGTFIYANKLPEDLKEVIDILTGTSYKKGQSTCL